MGLNVDNPDNNDQYIIKLHTSYLSVPVQPAFYYWMQWYL